MPSSQENTILLDCLGLPCPEPVIRCHKTIKEGRPGHITVLVDNRAAYENVTRALQKHGYTMTCTEERHNGKTVWRLVATCQGEHGETPQPAPLAPLLSQDDDRKTLVLLTAEFLGAGNDDLGAKLMENFLSTLPEMGKSLWKIVLLNGGVKLATHSGKSLESLKKLEALGVHILVCGACLTFYHLLEAKAVGETTNMLDVVTSLDLADKIICP